MSPQAPEEVAPGVRRLGSKWVNWYLLERPGGHVIVDSGFPKQRDQVKPALEALGGATVSDVVLTHWHPDHVGCGEWLRSKLGATIWAPRGEVSIITGAEKPKPPNFLPYLWRPALLSYAIAGVRAGVLRPDPIAEVEAYDTATSLPGGLRAIATPGHSRDHHALLDERNDVLFCGDALATINLLTGKPEPRPAFAGVNHDNEAVLASLELLETVEARVLLPGHGDPWRDGAGKAARLAREAGIPG